MALNYREEAFVDEFFKHDGNCYAAAIAAGYAEKTARYASEWINEKNQEKPTKKNVYPKAYMRRPPIVRDNYRTLSFRIYHTYTSLNTRL